MHDLSQGMHSLVGAPGTDGNDAFACNEGQGGLNRILDGYGLRLGLPAGVGGAVVFDQRRDAVVRAAQPGKASIKRCASCFWLAEPSFTTSSRMLRAPSGSPMSM